MNGYVYYFSQLNKSSLASVGGKGANLGELCRIPGIAVPEGFCISTSAYGQLVKNSQEFATLLMALEADAAKTPEERRAAGSRLRTHLAGLEMPGELRREILEAWEKTGSRHAYAVRSSATAEDLPGASFAGQQDTFLNVKGEGMLMDSIRRCWASLFTDRAIVYRRENGFRHDKVLLAVVVQRMVFPQVSGIMFTADPVTGNRRVVSIDAGYGLGEALVSGIVSADLYQVKEDKLIHRQVARKEVAIHALPEGGTARAEITGEKQTAPVLSEEQAVRLARLGKKIEEHFGSPQDIEWCLANDRIFILQSRPITTLYPVPAASGDGTHLFISLGHPQMMTEAMKPLGMSVLRTLSPVGKSSPLAESDLLREAGSRLFLDITPLLAYPQLRKRLPQLLLNVDELIGRAVRDFTGRKEFRATVGPGKKVELSLVKKVFPTAFAVIKNILYRENPQAIDNMNRFISCQVRENKEKLQKASGVERITQIQEILCGLMPTVLPAVAPYMGTALITYKLIGTLSNKWLGDTAQLGSISKSPQGNVTTEMGLALGDLADAVRSHPAVMEYLGHADNQTFFEGLKTVPGGDAVLPVFLDFFEKYGMRGTGEIDLTRPRWREAPTHLVPAIISHIKGVSPGQHRLDFLAGEKESQLAARKLLERLEKTPRGSFRVRRMQWLIKVHRTLIGIREHPKYFLIQIFDVIKQALLQEADKLVEEGVLGHREDIFWLTLPEIKETLAAEQVDPGVIALRREKFQYDKKLAPPRVITGEGEIITARPGAHVPAGALAGSPVSAGTVEGRARVVMRLEEANMDKGDILVAPYTDPGWTPLFPLAAGLVTEVGGLMTHGAVVAREYGIPAVVAVENATAIIQDGQQIRVDGTRGYVEILK